MKTKTILQSGNDNGFQKIIGSPSIDFFANQGESMGSCSIDPPIPAKTPQQWGVLFDFNMSSPEDARQ